MADQKAKNPPPKEYLPQHIGIIMDGNGRWAKRRGLPRELGHRKGSEVFMETARYCKKIGIRYLTVYAFSTENWKRPQREVDAIMGMLQNYLSNVENYRKDQIRLKIIGDRSVFSDNLQKAILHAEEGSREFDALTVNLALNYGGKEEILHAAKQLAEQCVREECSIESISEDVFSNLLYTAGQPDPDLIIRPSGEERLSNFMLWQAAYSELIFMDVLWPDFTPEHLNAALWEYKERDRRFGGV